MRLFGTLLADWSPSSAHTNKNQIGKLLEPEQLHDFQLGV